MFLALQMPVKQVLRVDVSIVMQQCAGIRDLRKRTAEKLTLPRGQLSLDRGKTPTQ